MTEALQFSLAPEKMLNALEQGQLVLTEGQVLHNILLRHPDLATGVIKVYSDAPHRGVDTLQDVQIIPRSRLIDNLGNNKIPGLGWLKPITHRTVGAMGSVFDNLDYGQEYIYVGVGEFYPMGEPIRKIEEPTAMPLFDFEYTLIPSTLEKIIRSLNALETNWFMFSTGGGSAHVIVEQFMPPTELPRYWAKMLAALIMEFPTFNTDTYTSIWKDLVKISRDPFINIEFINKTAEVILAMTKHADESILVPGRVFPLDLRHLGHILQRFADFITIQYLSKFPFFDMNAIQKYIDSAGIAYLRFTRKHGQYPELIAMEDQGRTVVSPNWKRSLHFRELPLEF